MDATINYLASHKISQRNSEEVVHRFDIVNESSSNTTLGTSYGMLWIDVEGTQYWSSSTSNNINFISAMLNEGKARGISMGNL